MASDTSATASLQATASDAFARLTDVAKDLSDETSRRYRQGHAYARDHVEASLGVAVAIGVLAGMLLARR